MMKGEGLLSFVVTNIVVTIQILLSFDSLQIQMNDAERQAVEEVKLKVSPQLEPENYTRYFQFSGSQEDLQERLQMMPSHQLEAIIDANITISDHVFAEGCQECRCLTVYLGTFLLFPFFFMFCDWWKRIYQDGYSVTETTYRSLQRLLSAPRLRNLTISINDNLFDQKKAQVICDLVVNSNLMGFTLYNRASEYDYEEREYKDFSCNLKGLKQKPGLLVEARWGSRFLS